MTRINLRILALLFMVLLAGTASFVTAQDELKGKDLRWMEEDVAALITQQEIDMYRSLNKDDRKLFQEIFWARRDPNPATDDNEFEKDFEQRQKQADKQFKAKDRKGYATDMGIVFLLLGEPDKKEGPDPNVTWIYSADPQKGIPDGLSIKFNGVNMEKTADAEQALELVRARYITNPTVLYAKNLEGRLMEPRKTDPNSPSNMILKTLRETQTVSSDVPFEPSTAFFRASEGSIYIPILYEIEGNAVTWQGDTADITAFGVVENTDGNPIYQFEESAKVAKTEDGRTMYEVPIQLQPGTYKLYVGVRDNTSATAGTMIMPLEVPDFYDGELVLSSVVVYNDARQVEGMPGTPGHAFQFGPVKFRPADDFKTDDTIGFFFFVYGMGRDDGGNANVTSQYIFFKDGARKGATKEGPLQANEQQAVGNAEIPLASFEPGSYKMQIKVKDNIRNQTLTEEVAFVVQGAGATQ